MNFKLGGFGLKAMLVIAVIAVVAVYVYDSYIAPKMAGVTAPSMDNSNNTQTS